MRSSQTLVDVRAADGDASVDDVFAVWRSRTEQPSRTHGTFNPNIITSTRHPRSPPSRGRSSTSTAGPWTPQRTATLSLTSPIDAPLPRVSHTRVGLHVGAEPACVRLWPEKQLAGREKPPSLKNNRLVKR